MSQIQPASAWQCWLAVGAASVLHQTHFEEQAVKARTPNLFVGFFFPQTNMKMIRFLGNLEQRDFFLSTKEPQRFLNNETSSCDKIAESKDCTKGGRYLLLTRTLMVSMLTQYGSFWKNLSSKIIWGPAAERAWWQNVVGEIPLLFKLLKRHQAALLAQKHCNYQIDTVLVTCRACARWRLSAQQGPGVHDHGQPE